jgi:hypothetical protein
LVTLRLPAFRFLHFLSLMGRNRNNGRPKGRPHPCPSLDRPGFAFDVTLFYWRALPSLSRAEKARAPRCAARTGTLAMRFRRGWLNELPLPRGERVGVRGSGVANCSASPEPPHPVLLPPISAFTRVFDALWGRRDPACRPRHSSLGEATIPPAPQRGGACRESHQAAFAALMERCACFTFSASHCI